MVDNGSPGRRGVGRRPPPGRPRWCAPPSTSASPAASNLGLRHARGELIGAAQRRRRGRAGLDRGGGPAVLADPDGGRRHPQGRPGRGVRRGPPRRRALVRPRRRPAARPPAPVGHRRTASTSSSGWSGPASTTLERAVGRRRADAVALDLGAPPLLRPPGRRRHADAVVRVNGEPVPVRATCRLVNHAGSYPRASRGGRRVRPRRPRRRALRPAGRALRLQRHGPGVPGRDPAPAGRSRPASSSPTTRTPTGACGPGWPGCASSTTRPPRCATACRRRAAGRRSPMVRFLAQRNALLCLVRNAPADVARHFLWRRHARGPRAPSSAGRCSTKLPWALASRLRMRRLWTTTPRARVGPLGRRRHDMGHSPADAPVIDSTGAHRLTPASVTAPFTDRIDDEVDEAPARVRERERPRPAGAPASTNCLRRRASSTTLCTDAANGRGSFDDSSSPASATVSGTAEVGIGHDGKPVAHGLDEGDAEPLVLRGADEHVGSAVVGLELLGVTVPVIDTASLRPSSAMKADERRPVGLAERGADEMEPGPVVVEAAVHGQHLDEVVLGLVGRHLARRTGSRDRRRPWRPPAGATTRDRARPPRSCR